VFAHFLFALDLEESRSWIIQATGFAAAGLVLFVGRFLTRRSPAPQPALNKLLEVPSGNTPVGELVRQWRQSDPHSRPLPAEIAFKVEDTWR
jgi:hypothetical protein